MASPTSLPIAQLRAAGCKVSRTYSGGWSVTPPDLDVLRPALADLGAQVAPDQRRLLLQGEPEAVAGAMRALAGLIPA